MKTTAYDRYTGKIFSYDLMKLTYDGIRGGMPDNCIEECDGDSLIGSLYMSGWSGNSVIIYCNRGNKEIILGGYESGSYWLGGKITEKEISMIPVTCPIIICGDIALNPSKLSDLCRTFNNPIVYVCPLVHGLASVGALVRHHNIRPCRNILASNVSETVVQAHIPFDKKLPDDCFGRMADTLSGGTMVFNNIKNVGFNSGFYGYSLSGVLPSRPSHVIVRIQDVEKLFPNNPISIMRYASTSVPVKMEVGEEFKKITGWKEDTVNVMTATDYIPGLAVFMRFYKTMSSKSFVWAGGMGLVEPVAMVFNFDKKYLFGV